MKKKQKRKISVRTVHGMLSFIRNVWIFHKIRTGSSISPKRGQAVSRRESSGHLTGGKIQTKKRTKMQKIQK